MQTYSVTQLRDHLVITHGTSSKQADRMARVPGPCPACASNRGR